MASVGMMDNVCGWLIGVSRTSPNDNWVAEPPTIVDPNDEASVNGNNPESVCTDAFGHEDFDPQKCAPGFHSGCPVRGCHTTLEAVAHRKGSVPFCRTHGLRLHAKTFVYFNGVTSPIDGRLRNFVIQRDAALRVALGHNKKVESHRLGYEMSEDALSWNVFVGLAEAGKLRQALYYLTGKEVKGEPRLYLWGQLIDLASGTLEEYAPLAEVRQQLERDIRKFKTEPDIMLIAEGELTVCIEAKFGSGNPIAQDKGIKPGEKPVRPDELIDRYYEKAGPRTKQSIVVENIKGTKETFHSQLFRNVIFASEMAAGSQWHVVNLVSTSQVRKDPKASAYSYADPTKQVQSYLSQGLGSNFTYRSWEGLYEEVIDGEPALSSVRQYMKSKSAHFAPAFTNI